MPDARLALKRIPTVDATLARFATAHLRVPLEELLTRRARRGSRRTPPVPHASDAFTWNIADRRSPHWWPQGIDVLPASGHRPALLVVSWFSQRGRASRLSLVDLAPRSPRYWHVSLVEPTGAGHRPVRAHAGGVAVHGDRLYIAATHGGLLEFDVHAAYSFAGARGTGGRLAFAQTARLAPSTPESERRLRFSFVSVESDRGGQGAKGLVVGEWRPGDDGRLARARLDPAATPLPRGEFETVHTPGVPNMQGAVAHAAEWFVSASRGDRTPGDLWVGDPSRAKGMVRLAGALAPGPEDLALDAEGGRLWNLSEFPGRRWVYALDVDELRGRAARAPTAVGLAE